MSTLLRIIFAQLFNHYLNSIHLVQFTALPTKIRILGQTLPGVVSQFGRIESLKAPMTTLKLLGLKRAQDAGFAELMGAWMRRQLAIMGIHYLVPTCPWRRYNNLINFFMRFQFSLWSKWNLPFPLVAIVDTIGMANTGGRQMWLARSSIGRMRRTRLRVLFSIRLSFCTCIL